MKILLANPRGFCAGVDRAISIVERALEMFEPPIYVRHEVVHNKYVVDDLKKRGAIFVEELDEIPENQIVIFSAHGVSKKVRAEAVKRKLKIFDATCPLVTKVHMEVMRASNKGKECILIGHKGHPEVIGTMGQYENTDGGIYLVGSIQDVIHLEVKNKESLCYSSQTTLSLDDTASIINALMKKFPSIEAPRKNDICYATQNRQDAVKNISLETDLVLVVGSKNSSNSNRLKEKARVAGVPAYLIDNKDDIKLNWFTDVQRVGLTAGASAPEILVTDVLEKLNELGAIEIIENPGVTENTVFELPPELRAKL